MNCPRKNIVVEILERLIEGHGVIPNADMSSAKAIDGAIESIFEIFGKTAELEEIESDLAVACQGDLRKILTAIHQFDEVENDKP